MEILIIRNVKCVGRDIDTLEHYIFDCEKIKPCRDKAKEIMQGMAQHLVVNGKIPEILRLYPLFASRKWVYNIVS